jgi:hypothetical protein
MQSKSDVIGAKSEFQKYAYLCIFYTVGDVSKNQMCTKDTNLLNRHILVLSLEFEGI